MPTQSPLTWLPLLQRALEVEIGIGFRVTGITRTHFRNVLYECRKAAEDPRLDALIMFLPGGNHTDEIWVCKKEVELGEVA